LPLLPRFWNKNNFLIFVDFSIQDHKVSSIHEYLWQKFYPCTLNYKFDFWGSLHGQIKIRFWSFDVRHSGCNCYFFDLLVSFCRLDLGLYAKTVFNKSRNTAASADRIFAVQRQKLETRRLAKSVIYKKYKTERNRD